MKKNVVEAEKGAKSESTQGDRNKENPEMERLNKKWKSCSQNIEKLTEANIAEVKEAYKQPPTAINLLGEAVCLCSAKKPSYTNFLSLISEPGFMTRAAHYNLNSTSDYAYTELTKYISDPEFKPDLVTIRHTLIRCFFDWIHLVYGYKQIKQSESDVENIQCLAIKNEITKLMLEKAFFSFYWPLYFDFCDEFLENEKIAKLNYSIDKIDVMLKGEKFVSINDYISVFNADEQIKQNMNENLFCLAEKVVQSKSANVKKTVIFLSSKIFRL